MTNPMAFNTIRPNGDMCSTALTVSPSILQAHAAAITAYDPALTATKVYIKSSPSRFLLLPRDVNAPANDVAFTPMHSHPHGRNNVSPTTSTAKTLLAFSGRAKVPHSPYYCDGKKTSPIKQNRLPDGLIFPFIQQNQQQLSCASPTTHGDSSKTRIDASNSKLLFPVTNSRKLRRSTRPSRFGASDSDNDAAAYPNKLRRLGEPLDNKVAEKAWRSLRSVRQTRSKSLAILNSKCPVDKEHMTKQLAATALVPDEPLHPATAMKIKTALPESPLIKALCAMKHAASADACAMEARTKILCASDQANVRLPFKRADVKKASLPAVKVASPTSKTIVEVVKYVLALGDNHDLYKKYVVHATTTHVTAAANRRIVKPSRKGEIPEGFSWMDYPPLENLLHCQMTRFYSIQSDNARTTKQIQFNQALTANVRKVAAKHGWTLQTMSDEDLRNRIRCYYKTQKQNTKKRLETLLAHADGGAQTNAQQRLLNLWYDFSKTESQCAELLLKEFAAMST